MRGQGASPLMPNVRFGSKAEVLRWRLDVRYTPNSGSLGSNVRSWSKSGSYFGPPKFPLLAEAVEELWSR